MVSVALLMPPSLSLLKAFLIVLASPASCAFCTRILTHFAALLHNGVFYVLSVDAYANYYHICSKMCNDWK